MPVTQRRVDYYDDDDDDDAMELSGWGNADFDVAILTSDAERNSANGDKQQQVQTQFAVAAARKKEQRCRREKAKKSENEAMQTQDVVHGFHATHNNHYSLPVNDNTDARGCTNLRRNTLAGAQVSPTSLTSPTHNSNNSKTTLPPKEFAVSGCVVPTPNFVRVTRGLSPVKRKQQQTQQVANLSPAQVLCTIVGLIDDDHDDDAYDQQPWRPTPLAVRKSENARFPPLSSSSNSGNALLSQPFCSNLEKKLRAPPVPFGARPIGQSLRNNATATTTTTSLLPPLVDANGYYNSTSNNKVQEHSSSMRRRNGGRKKTTHRSQQPLLTGGGGHHHESRCVDDLMAFPATC